MDAHKILLTKFLNTMT